MSGPDLGTYERVSFTHDGTTRDVFRKGSGPAVIGLRFTTDRFVPAERFAHLRAELGDGFIGVELPPEAARNGTPQPPHSVLTEHLVDEEGEATRAALDLVLDRFRRKLVSPTAPTRP